METVGYARTPYRLHLARRDVCHPGQPLRFLSHCRFLTDKCGPSEARVEESEPVPLWPGFGSIPAKVGESSSAFAASRQFDQLPDALAPDGSTGTAEQVESDDKRIGQGEGARAELDNHPHSF